MKKFLMVLCAGFMATSAHALDFVGERGYESVSTEIRGIEDQALGSVVFLQGTQGVLAKIDLHNVPQGWHAIHLHENGACEDDFSTAGGHASHKKHQGYGENHGFMTGDSLHSGDMPNIYVHRDGTAKLEYFLPSLTLAAMREGNGSAVILHEGADDYASQPSGAAGTRIACGVVK